MRLTVGTAGHIDHGKTALVKALTGIDCDRLIEEKRRGITIDLGFAHLEDGELQVSFVDVPGHERFVRNALAGLGGIRTMMLVVAADEGVKPQTREHLQICSLLEIPAGLAVLTKADLVGDDLLELAQLELEEELLGSPFEGAPIVAVSSTTGRGIDELRRRLLELAQRDEPDTSLVDEPARLPIDRAFHLKGLGVVVTGTLAQGRIRPGDALELLPGGGSARVRSVQVHGADRDEASAGERVSLQLAGVELERVARGTQAVEPGAFLATRRILVRCRLLPDAPAAITGAVPIRFHLYASERVGKLRPLSGSPLEPGGEALCDVRLDRPVAAARGDRFVVRRPSPQRTIGGGLVLDPQWIALRGGSLSSALDALAGNDDQALRHFVERAAERGAELPELARRFGKTRAGALERLQAQVQEGHLLEAPAGPGHERRWLSPGVYRRVQERAGAVLRDYFERQRMALGMPKAEAITAILGRRGASLADVYLDWLRRDRTLRLDGERVALPGRGSALTAQESTLADRIATGFAKRGLAAPSFEEIRAEVNAAPKVFEGLVKHLVGRGDLVRLPTGLFVSAAALAKLREDLQASGWERFGVGQFKDRFGLSRKWAIPLLEYLDAQGVTRRVGDDRQVVRRSA
ncbi:MAG TPA: selenocysteine-specific translation elongation factor [Thermoanaerobaculia bacterium]|nr:selenocysteine-specific translation elongation factor [Thermoanaerobaculia bacterium]